MLEFRKATNQDAKKLDELDKEIFQSCNYSDYASIMTNENSFVLVAMDDEKLVGYIYFCRAMDEAELYHVGVKEDSRKNHIATDLLKLGVNQLKVEGVKMIFLEARQTNKAAINLYVKAKFLKYKIRKDYYEKGVDAFCYMMEVK